MTKETRKGPYVYGGGTRLSNAYTVGRDGLPCPQWAAEPSSAAHKAWKQGRDEFAESQSEAALVDTNSTDEVK